MLVDGAVYAARALRGAAGSGVQLGPARAARYRGRQAKGHALSGYNLSVGLLGPACGAVEGVWYGTDSLK